MADQHPLRGLLDRIMYRAYAIRVVGATSLFNPGGDFDRNFALGSAGFNTWGSQLYHESGGYFQSNYFDRIFVERGLIHSTFGPDLPHFPFYEDVAPIHAVIREFMRSFVATYYENDDSLANDPEVNAWILEANGPAQVYDFPSAPLMQRESLVDILTQMAYLAGVMHHALNSGALSSSWTLPLHPTAHRQPLPTSKGIASVMPYLPNLNQSISQIVVEMEFNRPNLIYENRTLFNLFSDPEFLAANAEGARSATQKFMIEMEKLGIKIDGKQFDDQGLSQGMPFIYRDVNPLRIPFFLSI